MESVRRKHAGVGRVPVLREIRSKQDRKIGRPAPTPGHREDLSVRPMNSLTAIPLAVFIRATV